MGAKLTIIGAGPGGYVAAVRAAQLGAEVTVIEDREVGGACLNRGCIPTKTIIASTETLHRLRRAEEYGLLLPEGVRFDLERIRSRKDAVVAAQVRGIRELFKSWRVRLIEGRGSLLAGDAVRAVQPDGTTMDVRSDRIIIATGSRPASLPGIAFDGSVVLSSDDAVLLKRVPASILIIGAGAIGCEFAFIYRTLGAEVTIVETAGRVLPSEDEEIAAVIARELKKEKIPVITGSSVSSLEVPQQGPAVARLPGGKDIRAEQVLVSVGRVMNSGNLGLDAAGVATGRRGEITVNERMETSVQGIYAVGDVTGRMLLAHVASHQGLVAAENALGGSAVMRYDAVPSAVFTRPEVGSVGLRQHEAAERGIPVRTGSFLYRGLGKAHAAGEIAGMAKVIADAATDRVLGVHIVGAHASELVHEGVLAIAAGLTSAQLSGMVHAHPTLSETLMEAAGAVQGRAIHALRPGK